MKHMKRLDDSCTKLFPEARGATTEPIRDLQALWQDTASVSEVSMMVSMHVVMGEQSDHRNHSAGFCLGSRGQSDRRYDAAAAGGRATHPRHHVAHALLDTLVSDHALMRSGNTSGFLPAPAVSGVMRIGLCRAADASDHQRHGRPLFRLQFLPFHANAYMGGKRHYWGGGCGATCTQSLGQSLT